ncbi:hypothetical protein EW146_g2872 [Bondarzewia mesenterica]|uniref:Uncharacterized protein n=1 Tax=Bondarzewia mesenterica TaxID=1095465 RepID=A0A4S4LZH6_9AGAM|nr:hypothetical protein EW146_g2872 [Bondarzewia mesenterica]
MSDFQTDCMTLFFPLTAFDYVDIEDRGSHAHHEMLRCILSEPTQHNAKLPEDPWRSPEHIWSAIHN